MHSIVKEPEEKIMQFIDQHNKVHKPFAWTKPVTGILEKIDRAREVLANVQFFHCRMLDTKNGKVRTTLGAKR